MLRLALARRAVGPVGALLAVAFYLSGSHANAINCFPGDVPTASGHCMPQGRVDCGKYNCGPGEICLGGGKCKNMYGQSGCEPGSIPVPDRRRQLCFDPRVSIYCQNGLLCPIGTVCSGDGCAIPNGAAAQKVRPELIPRHDLADEDINQAKKDYNWPPNDGCKGDGHWSYLPAGASVDAYGPPKIRIRSALGYYTEDLQRALHGRYAAPVETPFENRSLPYNKSQACLYTYKPKEETQVWVCETARPFEQPGGGIQYLFSKVLWESDAEESVQCPPP